MNSPTPASGAVSAPRRWTSWLEDSVARDLELRGGGRRLTTRWQPQLPFFLQDDFS